MHTQVRLGDSAVELGETDQPPRCPHVHPLLREGHGWRASQAVAAGGKALMEPTDQFYGERSSGILDPCGNTWWISKQIEELSSEEIEERARRWPAGSRRMPRRNLLRPRHLRQ